MSDADTLNPTRDDFSELLEASFAGREPEEGSVISGRVQRKSSAAWAKECTVRQ